MCCNDILPVTTEWLALSCSCNRCQLLVSFRGRERFIHANSNIHSRCQDKLLFSTCYSFFLWAFSNSLNPRQFHSPWLRPNSEVSTKSQIIKMSKLWADTQGWVENWKEKNTWPIKDIKNPEEPGILTKNFITWVSPVTFDLSQK